MRNFNFTYMRHNFDKCVKAISPRAINFYDITIVLRGVIEYVIDGQPVRVASRDVICIPPGAIRQRIEGRKNIDYLSINFTADEPLELPVLMKKVLERDMLLLISAYDELRQKYGATGREKYEHIFSCLILELEERARESNTKPLAISIAKYIRRNMRKKITLEMIGKKMFFSPVYCDTVFKKEMGRSIIDYLLEMRISEAKRLLTESSRPLSEIAEDVGFGDYNYFSRVFKKRTGYTPREYRRLTGGSNM